MKESYSIQSVAHALDLLEVLSDEGEGVQISHLSTRLQMNKTSTFRLLATLEARGYVEREEGSKRYRLGMNAYEMAQKFLSHMTLLRKARPLMERLARQCDESVYLAVRRSEEVLFLDMIDTGQQVKLASLVGRRFPLGSLSAGKVIKAFSSSAVEAGGETLASELQLIRRVGFACDVGGGGDGVVCMAVPLFSGRGDVVGSLALLGPDFRLSQQRLMGELRTQLLDAAGVVSSGLGYLGYFEQSKRWLAAAPVEGRIALSA